MRKLLNIGNPNGDDDGAQFARFRSAAKRARSREDARPRAIGKSASSHGSAVAGASEINIAGDCCYLIRRRNKMAMIIGATQCAIKSAGCAVSRSRATHKSTRGILIKQIDGIARRDNATERDPAAISNRISHYGSSVARLNNFIVATQRSGFLVPARGSSRG